MLRTVGSRAVCGRIALALLAFVVAVHRVDAQVAVFTGRVLAAGAPLGGASVSIPEVGLASITSVDGRYTITVDATVYGNRTTTLLVRAIGFTPQRSSVVIVTGRIVRDYSLTRDVMNLDQVVVTGVADATVQKKTAFAVTVVDASALRETPGLSPLAGLAGKVAGASTAVASGSPGAEPAIRLRAPTSLSGRQDPLVLIDGTITRLGLADINAQDIERIEVIKGAAASSLYGSDAANGVIQIFTKRGANIAEGQTQFLFRSEFGQNVLPRKVGLNTSTAFQLDASTSSGFKLDENGQRISEADDISDNTYPRVFDALNAVFKPGVAMNNYLSIAHRSGATNFNASLQNARESGVLKLLDGYSRQNFRLNVDHALSARVRVSTGMFYGRSHADQSDEGELFFGIRFLEPNIDITAPNADGTPYNAVIRQPPSSANVTNPLYQLANQEFTTDRDRFTGSLGVSLRANDWLTMDGSVHYDHASANNKTFIPIGFLGSTGTTGPGRLTQGFRTDRAYNTSLTLTATRQLASWIRQTTKLASVYEDQSANSVGVVAQKLTVSGVKEFGAAAQDPSVPTLPSSNSITIRNRNLFAITTFDIKDRYIIDGLIRRDESSLFGVDERSAWYSRASAAWRFSEDFPVAGIDEGKVRLSFGTAGLRPPFEAQYEVFSVDGGSPSKVTLGNPKLKPAHSRELEAGFNLSVRQRLSFEYSYSNKSTRDQILLVPTSAATGYRNTWKNAATLDGTAHEVSVGAVLASTANTFWQVNLTGDRTRSRITALNVGPYLAGPDATDVSTRIFRVAPNQAFGIIYGTTWIRTTEQLETNIKNGMLPGTSANYRINELGYFVDAAAYGTPDERPLKYFDANGNALQAIGDVNPDFTLGFSNQLRWRGFALSGVLTWQRGGDIYNYTRQWPYNELRDADFDQRDVPVAARKPQGFFQTFYNNFDPSSKFVEDGSFVRLRELAFNYQLPQSWVARAKLARLETARVGIVGRNLWTATKYSGYDPDVSGPGGGNPFGYRVDFFTYPAYRSVTLMFELGY